MARKLSLCMVTLAILLAACSVSDVPPQNMPAKASPVPPTNTPSAKAVAPSPAQPTAVPTEAPLAAKVNGQPIVLADFEQEVARRQAALTKQGMDFNSPDGQAAVSMIRQQALEGLIEQALIDQQAAKLGITVADAEVDAAINQSIAEYGGMDAFTKYLKDVANMSMDEWRTGQREGMLTQKVIERVTRDVPTTAEQVHARHILVNTEAEANSLLARLRAGADFATLAQQYSKDTTTSAAGGDLGWFPRGALFDPALEQAAFDLQPGQISGVVQSDMGGQMVYHIVQVIERDPARALSDEALRDARIAAFQRWLNDLKTSAKIDRLVQ